MRYLVLTDIHANLEALEACLADAKGQGYDRVVVLGDLIGYCADPNAVVERIRALDPVAIVRGNHDKVATGLESADSFNSVARAAANWTAAVLTDENRRWVAALPSGPRPLDDTTLICHGSPLDEDEYIFGRVEASRALEAITHPVCLYGHTHYQAAYQLDLATGTVSELRVAPLATLTLKLQPAIRYLINPGAVGQPRDADPRAAYALIDTAARQIDLVRAIYPLDVTQEKIRRAGLPPSLADRLAVGR
jgi:diadenosine tetraphosphatase ApaH/serine/threonine PP2A family protein phosphatase